MHFAQTIKSAREAAGYSQEDLAGRTGVDRAVISYLERGTRPPGITVEGRATTAAIVDALGLPGEVKAHAFIEGWAARREREEGVPVAQTYAELRAALESQPDGTYVVFDQAAA